MKYLSAILVCAVITLGLVQAGAALSGSGVTTSPPLAQLKALNPGDVVSEVSGTINLPTSGSETFNADDSVEFYTQLDDAKWTVSIVIGGIENPARTYGGKRATIGGYDLSYPTSGYDAVALRFSMTGGKVPSSYQAGDIILVRALELDEDSRQVGNGFYVNGTVINVGAISSQLDRALADLATLRSAVQAQAAAGVDVTQAQAKLDQATTALTNAQNKIDTSPSEVPSLISTANTAIADGNDLLLQAEAEYSIDEAKAMLGSVDGLLTEFTVNDSIKETDPRLVPIINKRDLAAQAISNANDLFNSGSYASSQGKANDGLAYANQAWNLSLGLKTELGQGFQLPGLPNFSALLPIFAVIIVVLVVVGVIIYRRKMQWDELG